MGPPFPRSSVTVTQPQPAPVSSQPLQTIWMSFDDADSMAATVRMVQRHQGQVAVWLTDVPTPLTPDQEAVLWEVALRARSVVVPSRCALARVLGSGVVHPASVVVVPLPTRLDGSDLNPDAVATGGPLVVTPTALHRSERVDLVLDAVAGLRQQGLRVQYRVVGDPGAHRHGRHTDPWQADEALERWERWQQRASRLGLDQQVHWSLDGDPLAAMASAQVVALPWETDDLVASQGLIDAVSLGVPVVASSFPHAVELAPTGALTLYRSGSRQALERALHRVITRPLLRTAMRHAARQVAQAHTARVVGERLARLSMAQPSHRPSLVAG